MLKLTKRLILFLAVETLLPLSAISQEFTFAEKIGTWIVGFKEGSGTDRLTRQLQTKFFKHLPGNPEIIVLNKPNSGSVTASNDFHQNSFNDDTMLFMVSISGMLPVFAWFFGFRI